MYAIRSYYDVALLAVPMVWWVLFRTTFQSPDHIAKYTYLGPLLQTVAESYHFV